MTSIENPHLRAIIVDDEAHGRDLIQNLLKQFPNIEVVTTASNGVDALHSIEQVIPDIVFLDINMPGFDGIQVAERVTLSPKPFFIFITAYKEYAVQAFDAEAVDYLIKPLTETRFQQSIERAQKRFLQKQNASIGKELKMLLHKKVAEPVSLQKHCSRREKPLNRIIVKENGKIFFVTPTDVDYFEASGNYVAIHLKKKVHLIYETMSKLEQKLDPEHFLRIHRSVIVNINKIKELEPYANGEYIIKLVDNPTQLKLSRNYREQAKHLFNFG